MRSIRARVLWISPVLVVAVAANLVREGQKWL